MQTLKVCQDCPYFKIYGWRNSFNNILFLQHSFPSSLVARDSQFPLGLCSSADINNQNLLYLVWGIWTTLMKTNHEEKITLCWQTIPFHIRYGIIATFLLLGWRLNLPFLDTFLIPWKWDFVSYFVRICAVIKRKTICLNCPLHMTVILSDTNNQIFRRLWNIICGPDSPTTVNFIF